MVIVLLKYVTRPGKQALSTQNTLVCIMARISCSVCAIYPQSVSFIEFLMDFCTYNDILDTIWITEKSYSILNSQNQVKFYM